MPDIFTAIIGASGYGGAELLRLLGAHPRFKPACLIAASQAGRRVADLYPHLARWGDLRFERMEEARAGLERCGLVFCALPHGEAMAVLPELKNGVIIDLGGDFRLQDGAAYKEWYGIEHTCPALLAEWTYGLPELFADQIKTAARISNPGCYATAAILAAAPLCKAALVEGALVIDALSGTSGAGRAPKPEMHFAHVYDDMRAYKAARHQHTPEIEMALALVSGRDVRVSFTPHLVPAVRGIHVTCSAALTRDASEQELLGVYQDFYAGKAFVTVSAEQHGTKEVRGANHVFVTPGLDRRNRRAIITCELDNLVKGAAGQAIQNANIKFGYDETLGLEAQALYP